MIKKKNFPILLLCFFIFGSLFPTVRLMTIGSRASQTIGEYVFSLLPDLFAALIIMIVVISLFRDRKAIQFKPIDWVLIAFGITNVVIGFIIAGNLTLSAYAFRMTYYPMLFYFILRFTNVAMIRKSVRNIFYWFLVVGVVGIVLYFLFFNTMIHMITLVRPDVATYFIVRMTSVFWSPVVFATFMASAFLYFYYLFLTRHHWIYMAFMTLLIFCIVMAMSRGAMIAVLLGFILLSALMRDWKRSLYSLLMIVAVFCITAFYIATPGDVFFWLATSTAEVVEMKKGVTRVDLWINAFANFKEHPFGMGLGKAGHVGARFFSEADKGADVYSTDGWFLKILNETGVWGLFSYLTLIVFYGILYLRKKALTVKSGMLLLFMAIFFMVNVQGLVSNVQDFYLFAFLYWMIMGASVNLLYEPHES